MQSTLCQPLQYHLLTFKMSRNDLLIGTRWRINSNQNPAGIFAYVEVFVQGDTMNKIHIQRLEIMSGIH